MIQIKKLAIGLSICLVATLLVSAVSVGAQTVPRGADIDITLEPQSDGRLHFHVEATVESERGSVVTPGLTEGSATIDISSLNPNKLKIDASGTLYISNLDERARLLDMVSKEMLNNGIPGSGFEGLSSFEGRYLSDILSSKSGYGADSGPELPDELADLKIEELRCTKFETQDSQLKVGFTTTLSGTIFENEELLEELPINIEASFNASETSMSLEIDAEGQKSELSLTVNSTVSDNTRTTTFTLDGYTELPREGNKTSWNVGLPRIRKVLGPQYHDELSTQLKQNDVTLTLEVPPESSVSSLPSGAEQEGDAYIWTGDSAAEAVASMGTGQTEGEISYGGSSSDGIPWMWIAGAGVAIVAALIIGLTIRRR